MARILNDPNDEPEVVTQGQVFADLADYLGTTRIVVVAEDDLDDFIAKASELLTEGESLPMFKVMSIELTPR